MNRPSEVQDEVVVSMDYTLHVDGELVDSSEETGPIQFIQGNGEIIRGLEHGIQGMKVDESKDVIVTPDEGYGHVDPDAVVDVPRSEFPESIPLENGVELQVRDNEGHTMDARIVNVETDNVKLDFNHPLAGKELTFHVTVTDLRTPTEEEIAHGHVHSGDSHGAH